MEYRLSQIAVITGGVFYGNDHTVQKVFTDSRNSGRTADSLFFAIAGNNHDGHDHIRELYNSGIRSFIVERAVDMSGFPLAGFVVVEDSVLALQTLAAAYRKDFTGKVVAITGSNGKTVVKEWLYALLTPLCAVHRSPRSYNSQTGVPLSILMARGDEDVIIIEAGISKPGEMEKLRDILLPEYGILTNIGAAHQENFEDMPSKTAEKLKLFEPARHIIYNSNYIGVEDSADFFKDKELYDSALYPVPEKYRHEKAFAENMAAAATAAMALGYSGFEANIDCLQPVAMRLERIEGIYDSLIINDSYNSDINSLDIAVDYLTAYSTGREKMLILSDIFQSGIPSSDLYRKVAETVLNSGIKYFIGIGEEIGRYRKFFDRRSEFYRSTDDFLKNLSAAKVKGKAVLLKGSREFLFEKISHTLARKNHTTKLEVDLDAMIRNLNTHRGLIPAGVRVMAMIKANAYGNGSYEIASMLAHQGVDYLAVAFADEGVYLRERGICLPIVVLNADEDSFDIMVSYRLEPEIYSVSSLVKFAAVAGSHGESRYPVHIKLDTGMRRLGFDRKQLPELKRALADYKGILRIESIFSHLASSDSAADDGFSFSQISEFSAMSDEIIKGLGYRPLRHIANSAAIERFLLAAFDMVRLGIGLYGISSGADLRLEPVSTFKSRIVQIKEIGPTDTVGYGRSGVLPAGGKIATIPVGYADGFDRRLGNGMWNIIINGNRVPLIGRVCMDTCMADITGTDASEGDEVILFGTTPGNTVADMARVLNTIPYEIMTGISDRVKRIYIKE